MARVCFVARVPGCDRGEAVLSRASDVVVVLGAGVCEVARDFCGWRENCPGRRDSAARVCWVARVPVGLVLRDRNVPSWRLFRLSLQEGSSRDCRGLSVVTWRRAQIVIEISETFAAVRICVLRGLRVLGAV